MLNIPLRAPISDTINLFSSLRMADHISHPYKITGMLRNTTVTFFIETGSLHNKFSSCLLYGLPI
jgi:hypothetical protein